MRQYRDILVNGMVVVVHNFGNAGLAFLSCIHYSAVQLIHALIHLLFYTLYHGIWRLIFLVFSIAGIILTRNSIDKYTHKRQPLYICKHKFIRLYYSFMIFLVKHTGSVMASACEMTVV